MSRVRAQKRYDRNFRRLLAGAARVFYEKGYDRASIRDVSRRTDMSLAGIYYYVSGKEELLFQIQRHCFVAVLDSLRRRLAGVRDPEEKLRRLIANHLSFFARNMREMKVLSHEGEALAGGYYREIAALKRDYVRLVRGILAELLRRRGIRKLDPGFAALALFGMMNWIYTWYDPKRDGGEASLVRSMQRIFLHGILDSGRHRS